MNLVNQVEYFVDFGETSIRHQEAVLPYGVLDQAEALRLELKSQNSFAVTKVFRREAVAMARFQPHLHWGEECLFILQVLQGVSNAYYLSDALYHYVQSVGSATRRGFNPRRLSGIQTAAEIIRLVESSHRDLVPLARAFEGGILTELLMEGAHEDEARVISARELKTQLASVLLRTIFSREVSLRRKAQWLVALVNIRVLRLVRARHKGRSVPEAGV